MIAKWTEVTPKSFFNGAMYQIINGSVRIILTHKNNRTWMVSCNVTGVADMELACSDVFVAQRTAILVAKRRATKILNEICAIEDIRDASIF